MSKRKKRRPTKRPAAKFPGVKPEGVKSAPAPAATGISGIERRKEVAPGRVGSNRAFAVVSLCFLLSGIAGLVYQMVWMRYLSTVFGTSELAIVTVLVAYMGGLAAGAGVASRVVARLKRPILVYAILEAVIAASAALVPLLLRGVGALHRAVLGGQAAPPPDGGFGEALAYLGLGCLVLLIPTACMGATLPILAKGVVQRTEQIGGRVGWLYALNTMGAVIGVVVATFVLIPALGLWAASFVGVALNLTVAVLGWRVAAHPPSAWRKRAESEDGREEIAAPLERGFFGWVLLGVMLVSGAIAFAYEVLWARLLSYVLGGSLYAFGTMLAAFLGGIAVGGLVGAKLAKNHRRACLLLAGAEIAAGVLSATIFLYVASPEFAERDSAKDTLGSLAWLCIAILMPATVCLGATFPLAVRSLTEDPGEAGRSAGRVYSWNTIGAIVGAVGAGYLLIPAIGFAGTLKWAAAGNLVLGAVVLFAMRERPMILAVGAAVAAVVFAAVFHPQPPRTLLTVSPVASASSTVGAELIFHSIGHSATVAVLERRGSFLVRTNGLPEAEVFGKGAEKLTYTRIRWLPVLPKLLRPEAKSMLVVGFGGGALLEAVPEGIESIDVVELEAGVIEANKAIADRRAIDPLRDERINIIVNDVRGALNLTTKRYDTIVSQPSHPWTAGASHLYTREFLELARDHLVEKGVFVQWLGAHFVDESLFRSFAATMLAVFPHSQLYLVGDNFVLVGSEAPLDRGFLGGAGEGGSLIELSNYSKASYVEDVLAILQLDEDGFRKLAEGHRPITDDRNLMATRRPQEGTLNEPDPLKKVLGPLHFLHQESPSLLQEPSAAAIDYRYLASLLSVEAGVVDPERVAENVFPEVELLLRKSLASMRTDEKAATELLQKVLALDPDHRTARAIDAQRLIFIALRARGPFAGELPKDFGASLASNPEAQAAVARLTPQQRLALEAEHWVRTKQLARARAADDQIRAFRDHRDSFFMGAAQIRVAYLLDETGKTDAQKEKDAREAADYLDYLTSLPLLGNLTLIQRRIALAQRFGDTDYQVAAGWIMARKLATAPPGTPEKAKDAFRSVLGAIIRPYVAKDGRGRMTFSNRAIQDFHREVIRQVGAEAFPADLRP